MKCDETFNIDWVKQAKGLKIVHLNVRSLLAKLDEVKTTLLDGSIDIIVLSETWLHSQCSNELLDIDGFKLYRQDRNITIPGGKKKRGGGICIYVKDEFSVTTWPTLSHNNADIESLHVSCKLRNCKKVNLSVIYRPPSGNLQAALDIINDSLDEIRRSASGDTILLGDFNVDLFQLNAHTRKLKHLAETNNLIQVITSPTRITNTTETLIDHLYTNCPHIGSVGTLNYNI